MKQKIDEIKPSISKKLEKPLIQLPKDRSKLGISTKYSKRLQKIEEVIQKMEVKVEPSQVNTINQNDEQTSKYNKPSKTSSSEGSIDSKIKELEEQFDSQNLNKLTFSKVNPTSTTKNWYFRPTPPDLQFEEKNISNQFSF